VALSSSLTRQLPLRSGKEVELYVVMFLAVFLVVLSVLILAIHWLRTCSKSKI
jgi:maltodextrin utilization protein YvdJ